MTLFILRKFQSEFGVMPDKKTQIAFAGAMDSGMREWTIIRAIYETRRAFDEGGMNNQNPGKAVVQRLRSMYKEGIR